MVEVLVNTDILRIMLANGIVPRLPEVELAKGIAEKHNDFKKLNAEENDIVAVEYDKDEEVQCIKVADERHMYLTDGYIPTHNTSNIVFLKSTDDSMIETLSNMSGKTHRVVMNGKSVTRDNQTLFRSFTGTENKVTYNINNEERPVITYNDMAFINPCNSIVFRAGDSPIWNRNQTALPMSWRLLHTNPISVPGKKYSLQTVPTLSTAVDFDVKANQPNFDEILEKRLMQAIRVDEAVEQYQLAYGYSDYEMSQLNSDIFSNEIMTSIKNDMIREAEYERKLEEMENDEDEEYDDDEEVDPEAYENAKNSRFMRGRLWDDVEENKELADEVGARMAKKEADRVTVFAMGRISPELVRSCQVDDLIIRGFIEYKAYFERDPRFRMSGDGLSNAEDGSLLIRYLGDEEKRQMQEASEDKNSRVYGDKEAIDDIVLPCELTKAGRLFFASYQGDWDFANGEFSSYVGMLFDRYEKDVGES